jgi:ech hydrogenase subunit D
MQQQTVKKIAPENLLSEVSTIKNNGYRFVAISCTKNGDDLDIVYSFDKDYDLLNLQLAAPGNSEVDSISCYFVPAFLYENEIKELFGIKVNNILLDYNDNFYKKAKSTPFNMKEDK